EEVEVELGLEVGAALRTGLARPSSAAPAATAAPEQATEQIAQAALIVELEGLVAAGAATGPEPAGTAEAAGPERAARRHHLPNFVVLLALAGVTEDVVGGGDRLELVLRLLVPGVGVGVVLLRQLAVGARDLLLGCRLRHPEHVVVIGFEPLTLRRHGALPRDLHNRRTQHPAFQRVAGAEDVGDDGVGVTFLLHDRLVDVRVERLALGLDARHARLLEHAEQLGVHELDALAHVLDVVGADRIGVLQRQLERVEHRQQLLDQALGGAVDERRLLLDHALAVVLELRLHAPERVEVLVPLRLELGQARQVGFELRSRRLLLGDRSFVGVARWQVVARHRHAPFCSSSSTISASATSSSDGCEDPLGPVPPASPPAAPCCWLWAACWYSRCANSWLAASSSSCPRLTASMSDPARASLSAFSFSSIFWRSSPETLSACSLSSFSVWKTSESALLRVS